MYNLPQSKRLKNIIWHRYDVPWYWIQLKYTIKQIMLFNNLNKN